MVAKGLKEPGDKLQLIKVLSLGQVLEALEEKTKTEQDARGTDTDDGEESYREALGRLLNTLGLELVKLADDVCTFCERMFCDVGLIDYSPRSVRRKQRMK